MESMQLALETIVSTIFDGSVELGVAISETKFALLGIFEGCPVSSFLLWFFIYLMRILRDCIYILLQVFFITFFL